MGWAQGRYYRRSVRRGQRVITEYFGTGQLARTVADIDGLDRAYRRAARQEAQEARESLVDSADLATFNKHARLLIDAALVASGYYRHKRQWRRRRGGTMDQTTELSASATSAPLDWSKLHSALVAADVKKPAPGALAELQQLLTSHPNAWKVGGDLARAARDNLLSRGASVATQASVKEGLSRMRKELRGGRVNAIEDLAIEAILTAWVDHYLTMLRYAQLEDTSVEVASYWQRRLSLTQARYLRALRTLATVRKASIRLQINIADRQVNVNNNEA